METGNLKLKEAIIPNEIAPVVPGNVPALATSAAQVGDGDSTAQPASLGTEETATTGVDSPVAEDSCGPGEINPDDLRRALEVLIAPEQTTELFLFSVQRGTQAYRCNYSGYYDDLTSIYDDLVSLGNEHTWTNAYIRLNPVDPTLLSRGPLHAAKKGESSTDSDILRRRWLYVDVDPVRRGENGQEIKGIPATAEELDVAMTVADVILAKLVEFGWPEPVLGFSGNGCHILFRIELPVDTTLVSAFLNALKAVYETRDVIIDTTVANPSRLVRLYGTANCKGASTPKRPFRLSSIQNIPIDLVALTEEQLQSATEHLRALVPVRSNAPDPNVTSKPSRQVAEPRTDFRHAARPATPPALPAGAAALLNRVGLKVHQVVQKDTYAVHELEGCPCDRKEAGCSVTVGDSGALGLHCHHATCEYSASAAKAGQQWRKFSRAHGGGSAAGTDTDNAELLVTRHGDCLRYVVGGGWYCWNGPRWRLDVGDVFVNECAKETARSLLDQAKASDDEATQRILANAKYCLSARGRNAMISLAAREPDLVASPADFDKNPWLLGVLNGTLDLRTGVLRPADRGDLISIVAPVAYDPSARALQWQQFLDRVLPDREVQSFLQRLLGYALTGVIHEHVLTFFYGTGRNGKSTVIETFKFLLGDYSVQANPKLLLMRRFEESPVERMTLKGKRFAVCAETGVGRRLAEDVVKALTGGDTINARALYKDEINFAPTHKLVVATNHLPDVSGTDDAIWSRILVLPFDVVIPAANQDTRLLEKLREEAPGILAWAVQGCLQWQARGLDPPDSIRKGTEDHRSECDPVSAFFQECCRLAPGGRVSFADLFVRYQQWCVSRGEQPLSKRQLSPYLRKQNCPTQKANSVVWVTGMTLIDEKSTGLASCRSTGVPSSTRKLKSIIGKR